MENNKEVRATIIRGYGFWQHPVAVEKALCPDGKRRKVILNQDGQTGRCKINGVSSKGFIAYAGDESDIDYKFIVYSNL